MTPLPSRSLVPPAPSPPPGPAITLTSLYRQHAQQVARWAARLGGPGVDVEDIVQEVFLVVHRQLPGFRGDSRPTTWLFSITRNVVRRRLQRDRMRRFLLEALSRDEHVAVASADQDFERRQALDLVYRALAGLPERHRTAFILLEIEGLSGQEAAELTGVKVTTLRVWLMRAREQFAKRLSRLTG